MDDTSACATSTNATPVRPDFLHCSMASEISTFLPLLFLLPVRIACRHKRAPRHSVATDYPPPGSHSPLGRSRKATRTLSPGCLPIFARISLRMPMMWLGVPILTRLP